MERLLLCNDLINNALERFEAFKVGDFAKAQALVDSANPNQKAADLISFDAFADDEGPLSGDGGLSLPADSAPSSSSAGLTAGGLPLDLFSAPSPSPSPSLGGYNSGLGGSSSSSQPKPDPMSFFRNPQQAPQSLGSINIGALNRMGPSSSSSSQTRPQAYPPSNFGLPIPPPSGSTSFGLPPPQNPQGYSLSPQPSPKPNGGSASNGSSTQQSQPQQPPKKDAFADLVDLMS